MDDVLLFKDPDTGIEFRGISKGSLRAAITFLETKQELYEQKYKVMVEAAEEIRTHLDHMKMTINELNKEMENFEG